MKKFLVVLIILFICGVLSADLCLKQIEDSDVMIGLDCYKQYANAKFTFGDVFWDILYERIKFFSVLLLLCFTPLKKKLGVIFLIIFSFIWGFFLMNCIIELGVAGLVVGLACVLPHGILYGVVVGLVLNKSRTKTYHTRNRIAIQVLLYIVLTILFITGCILESLVGTHFIPWVIRLSLI